MTFMNSPVLKQAPPNVAVIARADMPARLTGVLKKYFTHKGFGFIAVKGYTDMFYFHIRYFGAGHETLVLTENETEIEFSPDKHTKGFRALHPTIYTPLPAPPVAPVVVAPPQLGVGELADDVEGFVELRVRSSTPSKDLAGSIVAHIMNGHRVRLIAIGHGAVAQAIKAVPIASGRTVGNGYTLAIVPSFDVKMIESPDTGEEMERTLMVMQVVKVRPQ